MANTGYIQTPDGNSIFMWSYANADAPDNGAFQSPGPVLCVTQGEVVVVNLHNTLPEKASIAFPGQVGVVGSVGSPGLITTEAAAAGGDVTYTFTASQPGTYLYQSGSDVSKQVEMGLYGALIVRPSANPDRAYGDASTAFNPNREFMLLLAEIDPDLHRAVETGGTYDFTKLHSRYYTINGRSFPDTIQDNDSVLLPTQPYGALVRIQPTDGGLAPALVRMLNAGALNHPFHPHGNHTREIAQDGRLMGPGGSASTEHFGETIGCRADRGLPSPLGRRRSLEPQQQSAARGAAELPEPDVQGRQHLLQRQPVPRLLGDAADGDDFAEHLRRVVLPTAQPRARRVLELRRGLRRHGNAAAGGSAGGLLHLPHGHEDHHPELELRGYRQPGPGRRQVLQGELVDHRDPTTNWYGQFTKVHAGAGRT